MLIQYRAIETCRVGRGSGMKGKGNSRFPVNSLSLFSREFSPVFTVATGEIRGIRFPQEGNVFHT